MVSMYYDARVLRNMRLHTPTGRYSTQAIQNVVELNAVMELTCVAIAGPNRSLKVIVEIVGLKGRRGRPFTGWAEARGTGATQSACCQCQSLRGGGEEECARSGKGDYKPQL